MNPSRSFIFMLSILLASSVYSRDTTLIDLIHLPFTVSSIASDANGEIFITSSLGLQQYIDGSFIVVDSDYNGSIVSKDGEIVNVNDYDWEIKNYGYYPWYKFEHWLKHLPGNQRYVSAATDEQGKVWVADGANIYIFKIEDRFNKFFEGHSVRGMEKLGSSLYVQTYEGIYCDNKPLFSYPQFGEGYISNIDGDLFFNWSGLLSYNPKNQNQKNYYDGLDSGDQGGEFIVYLTSKINDTLWVGTSRGLGYLFQDAIVFVSQPMVVEDFQENEGRILIATSDKGIFEKVGSKIAPLNFPDYQYYQILFHKGKYYFASSNGLVVWDGKSAKEINVENGLSNDFALNAVIDNEGFLWVSTLSGLNRINLDNGVIIQYLNNVEFNKRSFLKNQDTLYFGGVNGIYRFASKDFLGDDFIPLKKVNFLWVLILGLIGGLLYFAFSYFKAKGKSSKEKQEVEELIKEKEKEIFLFQLEQYIFQHNIPTNVQGLASYLGVSERSLYRTFNDYGLTPGDFIKAQKLKKAKFLIEHKGIRCLDKLSVEIGYSKNYLSKLIKESFEPELFEVLN